MKKLLACLALVIAAVIAAPQTAVPPPPYNFPTPPESVQALWKSPDGTRIVVFKILPGQALKLYDPYYDFVRIESRFPVAVYGGDCHETKTTQADCRNVPPDSYIKVYDSRVGASPEFSAQNGIKITALKH
ncbi:MAG: hypothetical protein WA673_19860 [Candidatus Acidiferrales bacterium]